MADKSLLNASHPKYANLLFATGFAEQTGTTVENLVTPAETGTIQNLSADADTTPGTEWINDGTYGTGIKCNTNVGATATGVNFGDSTYFDGLTEVTFMVAGRANLALIADGVDRYILDKRGSGTDTASAVWQQSEDVSAGVSIGGSNYNSAITDGLRDIATKADPLQYFVLGLTYSSSNNRLYCRLSGFINNGAGGHAWGELTSGVVTISGAIDNSVHNFLLAPVWDGEVFGVYIWGEEFSASDWATYAANLDSVHEAAVAATLSDPDATTKTDISVTPNVTTNQASGTLYAVVDSVANLTGVTASQIKLGNNVNDVAAVSANTVAVSNTNPSLVLSGLTAATAYRAAFVQSNTNGDSNVVTVDFTTAAVSVSILSMPATIRSGETGVDISVSNAGASQGTGNVTISDGTNTVSLTETAWADNEITVTIADIISNNLKPGTVTITVTTDGAESSDSTTTTLLPAADYDYVTVGTVSGSADNVLEADSPLVSGDLCQFYIYLLDSGGTPTAIPVTVLDSLIYTFPGDTVDGTYRIRFRFFDESDHTWGAEAERTLNVDLSPTQLSATINTAGTQITFGYSENVDFNSVGGYVLSLTGGAATLTYVSGDGSTSLVFSLSRVVYQGEVGTLSYTNPGNGIEASSDGTDVGDFFGLSVTNNSTQTAPTVPVITGPTTPSVNENVAFAQNYTITDLSGGSVSLSGPDSALFGITNTSGDTWQLTMTAKDFEAPVDANTDNVYQVTIEALGDVLTTSSISVSVLNVLNPGVNLFSFGTLLKGDHTDSPGQVLTSVSGIHLEFRNASNVVVHSATVATDVDGYLPSSVAIPGVSVDDVLDCIVEMPTGEWAGFSVTVIDLGA